MSRTRKFLYNTVSKTILQIVIMLVGFILPRTMLVYYGSEINGLVSSISQFIRYFSLVEAGLGAAVVYSLYKPLADENHKKISGIIVAARDFYYFSGYIFVVLTVVLSFIYPVLIKTENLTSITIGLLVLVLGVSGALEFFTLGKYRALLTADQRNYVISIASIVQVTINCAIIVMFARYQIDIALLRFIALFAIFSRSFILWYYCRKNYPYINYNEKPSKHSLNKRWDALYLEILGVINSGASVIIATFLCNLLEVSIYSVFNMVITGLNGILGIFRSGLAASFGDIIARGEIKKLQKIFKEFETGYYGIITIIYATAAIMLMSFIQIYTKGITDANYNRQFLGALFVFNGLMYNLKTPQGMLVISAGLYKETKRQTITQALIMVFGGIILGSRFGLEGIMVASIISNVYRDIDLMFFIPENVTKLPVFDTFQRMVRCVLNTIIICIPFYIGWINIVVSGYVDWAIKAIGVFIFATLITGINIIIFDRSEVKGLINRFIKN